MASSVGSSPWRMKRSTTLSSSRRALPELRAAASASASRRRARTIRACGVAAARSRAACASSSARSRASRSGLTRATSRCRNSARVLRMSPVMSVPASDASSMMRKASAASPSSETSRSARANARPVCPNAASTTTASTGPFAKEATCSSMVSASRRPPSARYAIAPRAASSITIPSASATSRIRAIIVGIAIRRNA